MNEFPIEASSVNHLLNLGTGWMENSAMFYGFYDGTYDMNITYNFPLAYFLVITSIFAFNLTAVVRSSSKSFRANTLSIADTDTCHFTNLALGGWDYTLAYEEKESDIQRQGVTSRLKFQLEAIKRLKWKNSMTSKDKFTLFMTRLGIWTLAFLLLVGLAVFMFFLAAEWLPKVYAENNCLDESSSPTYYCLAIDYLPSLIITVVNLLFPYTFSGLIRYEKYAAHTELIVDLARNIFLRLASLFIVFLSIFFGVRCDYHEACLGDGGEIGEAPCDGDQIPLAACYNSDETVTDWDKNCEKPICWESFFGQEFYKLTILDFGVQFIILFLVDFPRVFLFGRLFKNASPKLSRYLSVIEFDISKNVLDIVYSQTICWLSIYFAPLIVTVTIIKSLVFYCLKIVYVLYVSHFQSRAMNLIDDYYFVVVHTSAYPILRNQRDFVF